MQTIPYDLTMRESWQSPFGNAFLKIERANHHITDIDARITRSADRNGASLHMNAQSREQFVYFAMGDEMLPADLGLIAGDAIHNLHSALDIAWQATVKRLSPEGFHPKHTKFPVSTTRDELETKLVKTGKFEIASTTFRFMVDHVKPYEGGDADIVALHHLDIDDKHKLLIPIVTVTQVTGVKLKEPDGTTIFNVTLPSRIESYRKIVPNGTQIENYGDVAFHVTLGEIAPIHNLDVQIKNADVRDTLRRFSIKVEDIVLRLQRL
jgi:hypothetical protein